jgi:methylmalonyl-CoA mutase
MSNEPYANPPAEEDTGPLFGDFPVPTYADWRKLIDKTLKGVPFEKKLVTRTYEGIDLQPLYRLEDSQDLAQAHFLPGFTPYVRSTELLGYVGKPWEVCQELPYSTPEAFNQALRADLERGQNAVNLVLDRATRLGLDPDQAEAGAAVGQGGVSIASVADLDQALAGVELDKTPLFIQASTAALPIAALLLALAKRRGQAPAKLQACLGLDPLGALAREGSLPRPLERIYDTMARLIAWAAANAPGLQILAIQGHPYHDGGGSVTQELAYVLATAVDYLRAMQARGLEINTVAPRLRFSFSISSQFFMEVARLRAARLLWAKIVQAFGGNEQAQKMVIHARTSAWNKTVYDPYVNLLRTTVEAFAGAVGGVDSLHVSPFDEVIRTPDEFSRRIARNTHIILREEAHIPRTIDPAGGSWYVESLTDAVARKAWSLFQEVEQQGGMYEALQAGTPQSQVAEIAARRAANLARRKDIFVGTNRYANLKEKPLEVPVVDVQALQQERTTQLARYRMTADATQRQAALEALAKAGEGVVEAAIQAADSGATLGEIARTVRAGDAAGPGITPLCIQRGARPFEILREAADAYAARTGARVKIFLATMGPLSQHKARADFARGFLEVGGFEVVSPDGFATVTEAAQVALASAAPVVVICSTDPTYPELVPPLVHKLKAARPDIAVLVAGYPADQVEALQAAGVDDFIYRGANCHDLLLKLQKKTGVVS